MQPITVVETDEFLAVTRKLMDDEERARLVNYLAIHPTDGVVIPGTGGVRKLRWGLEGRGKRGGARVIYFFHDMEMPLYLLTAFAKNERENLSQSEINTLKRLTRILVDTKPKRRFTS